MCISIKPTISLQKHFLRKYAQIHVCLCMCAHIRKFNTAVLEVKGEREEGEEEKEEEDGGE